MILVHDGKGRQLRRLPEFRQEHSKKRPAADIARAFTSPRLGLLRPLERKPSDHRVVAEAGADAVDKPLYSAATATSAMNCDTHLFLRFTFAR
jgi:hypothetical protein